MNCFNDKFTTFRNHLQNRVQLLKEYTRSSSCFLILPTDILKSLQFQVYSQLRPNALTLLSHASEHAPNRIVSNENNHSYEGVISWVTNNKRSIYISPFERDARSLGLYNCAVPVKSFIATPLYVSEKKDIGVLACDSANEYAFDKSHSKMINCFSQEISEYISTFSRTTVEKVEEKSWHSFIIECQELIHSLGRDSVEIMRINFANFNLVESRIGTKMAMDWFEKLTYSVKGCLNTPYYELPSKELIVAVDKMVSASLQCRINEFIKHIVNNSSSLHVGIQESMLNFFTPSFIRVAFSDKRTRGLTIEQVISLSSNDVYQSQFNAVLEKVSDNSPYADKKQQSAVYNQVNHNALVNKTFDISYAFRRA